MQIAIFLVLSVVLILVAIKNINMVQLQGYKLQCSGVEISYQIGLTVVEIVSLLIAFLINNFGGANQIVVLLCTALPLSLYAIINIITKRKTPLVITNRVIRFFALFTIVTVGLLGVVYYLSLKFSISIFYLFWINILLSPFVVRLCFFALLPMEKHISKKYFKKATDKLDSMKNLVKIGITGSYGKTSVKNILSAILSEQFKVVASPLSFNTPMGFSKSVNEITDDTEIFVMEIGARKIGDVSFVAKALKPQIGIITGVAEQHLQTFGSIEDVARGKYELIEALPQNGVAVFNGEDVRVKNMYDRCPIKNKILSGLDSKDIWVENILTRTDGTYFDLWVGEQMRTCHTNLIGKHNIQNILIAVNVAVGLGMDIDSITYGIEKLQFTPHRLEVLNANGITIIDDTYNANIVGVNVALDTLALFDKRKIVVCQGIVELGDKEDEINYNVGCKIANIADITILVGKLANKIQKGLLDSGYNPTRVIKFKNLREAQNAFKDILKKDDVILLLNDLPDNY